ncbi:MAG: alcohol dehydrogenase catalytic domain-containing protein [Candidatus Obscuribacter sp.]|nr:alcohol dehydrogenase catalytic domain-containing protein [Candidatus Obscuribacter sp.]
MPPRLLPWGHPWFASIVPGHEIVGKVEAVGQLFRPGDRVGIGTAVTPLEAPLLRGVLPPTRQAHL